MTWQEHAACKDSPLDFIAAENDERNRAKALQVCGRCPVLMECREYALADASLVGIWGGADSQARRAMRRNRKAGTSAPA